MPRHYDDSDEDLYENPYAESDTDADDEDVDVVENPASVVRTARDERLWRMAKASAARQGRARDWAYVMGIFQRMKHRSGSEPVENPDARWQKYGPKGLDWGGEWLVTVDGRQFRAWRDAEIGAWYYVPASDTTTKVFERARGGKRSSAVRLGGFSKEECVADMSSRARENPDEEDEDAPPPPSFQLRASPTQQGLFAPSSYEAKPQKKKPAAPVDTRQRDLFGLPIESDDEPRENPRERTIREIKESRQYKAGAAAYRQLDRSAKSELGDQLVLGEFDWMDWFSDKPHPDFLRGFKNAWSPEDE